MLVGESWNWSYVILERNEQKYTLKCLHYQSHENNREFYRIYPQDFDHKKMASEQPFGFGYSWEQAFKRFFATLEMERRCARSA
jgi:hypothetical protein